MKKSLAIKIFLLCLCLCLCSCSPFSGASKVPLYINIFKTLERDPFYELCKKQEDKWGFEGVFAHELIEKMPNEEFFFYLYDSSVSDTLMEEMLIWGFAEKNIDVLAKGYVIDFSILNDVEKEKICEFFPENTLYAIQNGTVISAFSEYPLIPKEQSSDYDKKYKTAIESWIYSTMVGVNNHGFETVTYEEVQRKIENEEIFMLYVGRNSCKFCQVFVPVLKNVMDSYNFYIYHDEGNEYIPLYYLDTQNYYNDIIYGKSNAEETWDDIKETFNLDFVPGFLIFNTYCERSIAGMPYIYGNKQFENHITSSYFTSDLKTRTEMLNTCREELRNDMNSDFLMEEKNGDMTETNMEDNRSYLFDYDSSYIEDCFTPKDQWVKKVNDQEYIDIADDTYLENLKNNILKYSVKLTRITKEKEDSVVFGGSSGTGFIIDIEKDCVYIATNKHVISSDIKARKGFFTMFCTFEEFCNYTGRTNTNKYLENKLYKVTEMIGIAHIVGYSDKYDFAIVRFDLNQKELFDKIRFNEIFELSTPPRFDKANPQVGDKVYHWDINDIWDDKVKLKEHSIVNLDVSNNLGSHFIEITSGSRHGNSGSGVFNEKGECVGILVGSNPSSVYILPSSIFLKECEKILGRPLYQN